MPSQENLSSALARDFWAYAGLALDPETLRALEEACRKAGAAPQGRRALAGDAGPSSFTLTLAAAAGVRNHGFLHHAGYYCGASAARRFEGNLHSPGQGARRLVGAIAAACPTLRFELHEKPDGTTALSVTGARPLDGPLKEFAGGFLRGAAQRLNEGDHPTIRERLLEGGRVWSAAVDWGAAQLYPQARVKGGSRTPHK